MTHGKLSLDEYILDKDKVETNTFWFDLSDKYDYIVVKSIDDIKENIVSYSVSVENDDERKIQCSLVTQKCNNF